MSQKKDEVDVKSLSCLDKRTMFRNIVGDELFDRVVSVMGGYNISIPIINPSSI